MIERTDAGMDPDRPLMTFRVSGLPTEVDAFEAERIDDHRRVYLSYEGELSGGRGTVLRLASGHSLLADVNRDSMSITLGLSVRRQLMGERLGGRQWRFRLAGESSDLAASGQYGSL